MKYLKRVLCIILSMVFILQMLTGCSSKKTDETLYITKGEFFSYFVYDKNMTSSLYTAEDIQACKDGSVEADIIVEWGYLSEKAAHKDLKKPVNKETVVTVCANATFNLKEGKVSDIKDADLLEEPQTIANAYASGFFELENGYFDGAEKMSFADCEDIMNKAKEYTANFHFEANTEKTEIAEGVIEQDSSNYSDGDIIIDFDQSDIVADDESTTEASGMAYKSKGIETPCVTLLSNNSQVSPKFTTLEMNTNSSADVVKLNTTLDRYGFQSVKGFTANILKRQFEVDLQNPKIDQTVVLNRFQVLTNHRLTYGSGEIIGVLKQANLVGDYYVCYFEYPDFEKAVEDKNVTESNRSGINVDSFVKEKEEYMGWKLTFDVTSSGVKIEAKKPFTVYETGRKQDWQNSKKTMTATASFSMSEFNVDVQNLQSFATKKGTGFLKITCDTSMDFTLESSLRYTPDSNRNGKFPSNWNTSRWTDSNSAGAEDIKIARFTPSVYGVVSADVYIYMRISVDGKVTFGTSIDNGGVQITAQNGNVCLDKLGTKTEELSANVNLHGRLGVDASLKIFNFINVIQYDVGADLNIIAVVNLYYEEQLSKSGVFADEEGLNEYAAEDSKFEYCAGILIKLNVSGELKDSGVKLILNLISKGTSLNFDVPIWSGGFHFEDGGFVDKCTRGDDMADELKKAENDEIELGTYKVIIEEGKGDIVYLKAIPSETMDLLDTKNSITVKSNNKKVCTAEYIKKSKVIIIEATGVGSTEIVINAKKGFWFWKETCEQKISVTVNPSSNVEATGMSYIIIDPSQIANVYYV